MIPRLYYDSGCPVCRSFAKLLDKHLKGAVELIPMEEESASQAREFRLETSEGHSLYGEQAVHELARLEPRIEEYFWMLPPSYRGKALVRTYKFGNWLRRLFRRPCGRCPSQEK